MVWIVIHVFFERKILLIKQNVLLNDCILYHTVGLYCSSVVVYLIVHSFCSSLSSVWLKWCLLVMIWIILFSSSVWSCLLLLSFIPRFCQLLCTCVPKSRLCAIWTRACPSLCLVTLRSFPDSWHFLNSSFVARFLGFSLVLCSS